MKINEKYSVESSKIVKKVFDTIIKRKLGED